MATITFLSTDIETKRIEFGLEERMKDVCKKYAEEIKKDIKKIVFYSNGKKLNKKMTVSEFNKSNQKKELFVVIMEVNVDTDSEEEKAKKLEEEKAIKIKEEKAIKLKEEKAIKLKEEILDSIKDPKKEITYEEAQEQIVQYGYDSQKRIEKEKEEHPENFIEIEEAIKKKDTDKKLYVLGKLGKSLENMGIEVAIDKREGKNKDDSLIVNQIISSGILQEKKYEIHYEDNYDINKKYAIINNENGEQEKFIEEMKGFLEKHIGIPKKDIFIANIRKGCLTFDAIFKNKHKVNIRKKMIELAKLKKIQEIYEQTILGACKLSPDMLDERGNRDPEEWPKPPQTRGEMPYNPPTNKWIGYGLKVWDQYDNGNNDWIAMDGNPNEWAVVYHGTTTKAVKPICEANGKFFSTVEEGATGQYCEEYININKKSQYLYKICGEGAYCSPFVEYANKYGEIVIMCRANPKRIRIPSGKYGKDEYITDGTKNSIRPYRILVKL